MDDNDNSPDFQPTTTYYANISESQDINTDIIRVTAVDKDKKQTITYGMSPSSQSHFQIDSTSG